MRRWIEVVYRKRSRRDERFIDNVAMLGDGDFGVAVRHSADRRGEAALAIRQHFIIGHQLDAAKLHAVENVAARKGIAHPQQAFE